MITLKNLLVGIGFTFLLFFGIPISLNTEPYEEQEFQKFIEKYNKSYENETIFQYRFKAFKDSLEMIKNLNSLNSTNTSAKYGITRYSDMYQKEFLNNYLQDDYSKRRSLRKLAESDEDIFYSKGKRSISNIPDAIDWREKGVVTDVNNQHACGACWAFSTIQNIETMYAIKTGNLTKLSTQQAIDCARYKNDGCHGGDMCTLLAWLKDKDVSLETEIDYPLHLKNEKCKMRMKGSTGIKVKEYECDELIDDEEYILAAIAKQGPVAVAINALSWQNYLSGIIQFHCESHPLLLNHAVQIVGYNRTAEIPYYIVRNSWGTEFGDDGYLYIQIGKNLCGLATEVSAVNVY